LVGTSQRAIYLREAQAQGGIRRSDSSKVEPLGGTSDGETSLEGEAATTSVGRANVKKAAGPERVCDTVWGCKASKGEPHERDRDEIGPADHEGSKTSRG
jgi:hypothetical protein